MKVVKPKIKPAPKQLPVNPNMTPPAQSSEGLPDGWRWVKLGDLGKVISGGTPSTSDPSYWSDEISWITPADLSGYEEKFISKGRKSISKKGLENSSAKLLPKGSVLFSSRAPIGYVAIASGELATNQGFKNIIPSKDVISDFLYYYLKASKQLAEASASGTTFKEISGTKFGELPMPLPPLTEQHAIVSKIEELLSELDKGKQQLETAQQQLKIYRQAVLKWAFEGKLTNKNVQEGELPEGWRRKTLAEVCDMKAGFFVKASEISEEFQDGLFPCYGGNGLRGYVKSSTHEGMFPLVGRQGALCGNVHLVSGKFHATEHAVVVTPKEGVEIKWLYHKLISMRLSQYSTGTAQPGLSVNKLLPVELSIPPIQEQSLIAQEIESRLSVCDKVEETINQSLAQAETLRQSILKKAFEGKLV